MMSMPSGGWRVVLGLAGGFACLSAAPALADDTQELVDVLIAFRSPVTQADIDSIVARGGQIKYVYRIVDGMAASVPAGAIAGIDALPRVRHMELDSIGQYTDEVTDAWGVDRIDAEIAHQKGQRGQGVKVADLDSGIDANHPEFAGTLVFQWDFEGNDPIAEDPLGHGTHTAGTIAAVYNGVGVVGVAPECQLHMLKVGGFFPVTSAVIAALDWSVANGVKVTNSSFTLSPGPMVQAAYDNSYAAGVVHCAASGNGFPAPIGVPAKYASVIAVGATNKNDSKAPFSQTGPELDVVAPGVDVLSCAVGGGYVLNSGTSMACPHAVGVAALIIGSTGLTDPDDVRQRMIDTAEDLGTPGFDNNFGYGIVDAEAAVGDVAPCAADCNGDGKANILDFLCFQGLVTNGDMGADCTGDGEINVFDWLCFQGLVTKGC